MKIASGREHSNGGLAMVKARDASALRIIAQADSLVQ
jgi:hypothetical protein